MVGTTAPAPSLWVKDGAKGRLPGGGFLLLGFDCSGSKPHSQGGTQSTCIVSLPLFSKQGNLQVLPRPHTGLALPFFFRFHEFLQSMLSQGTWGPELLQVSQIWFVGLPWTQRKFVYICAILWDLIRIPGSKFPVHNHLDDLLAGFFFQDRLTMVGLKLGRESGGNSFWDLNRTLAESESFRLDWVAYIIKIYFFIVLEARSPMSRCWQH